MSYTFASLKPFDETQPVVVNIQSSLKVAVKFLSMVTTLSSLQFSTEIKCILYPFYIENEILIMQFKKIFLKKLKAHLHLSAEKIVTKKYIFHFIFVTGQKCMSLTIFLLLKSVCTANKIFVDA